MRIQTLWASFLSTVSLAVLTDTTIKLIANLEPRSHPGSHWVAIYRRDGKAHYFDTFGRPPPKTIHAWLSNNSLTWSYFDKVIQAANDKVSCGYLCLEYLKKL